MITQEKFIALIGMPGCGKSTLARALSRKLHLPCVDTDEMLVERAGKTIPELFAVSEEYFRDCETETLRSLCGKNSLIVACGGGIIKREENRKMLRENAYVVYLNRPVESIYSDVDISGRPLLAAGREKLYNLYRERHSIYSECADLVIVNDETPKVACERVAYALVKGKGGADK